VLRISDSPVACSFGVAANAVCECGEIVTMISEDVVPVMVYKFNLSVNVSSPVGKVVFCGEFAVCFTPKDVLFDMGWEIVSYSGLDLNKISRVMWVKWMFQMSCGNTGMKAFKMEDLLLLAVGEACLWWIRSGTLDLEG
jgi:hypothetical protein